MAIVDQINYIQGTDREFDLIVRTKPSLEPKDLSAFVGGSGDGLKLTLPGDDAPIDLTLDDSADGKLEVVSNAAGLAGKVHVTLKDGMALLKVNDGQDMELCIKEGAGPDFAVSKVQFIGKLNVKKQLFS